MYFSKKDKLKTSLLEAKVDDDKAAPFEYEGGSTNTKLAHMDFREHDANFSRLNQLQEIAPRNIQCPKPENGDVTIDQASEALEKFQIDFKTDSKELGKIQPYQEADFENDKKKKDVLTANEIMKELSENDDFSGETISDLLIKQTEKRFAEMKKQATNVKMTYIDYKKNFIQCSNLVEQYDIKDDQDKWVFIRVQKIHDAKMHHNMLRVFKKKGDKQTEIFMIDVSHKDVFCHASNISRVLIGQFLYLLRIEKNVNNYTLKFERYDLIKETVTVLKDHTIELPEKITADIIKFVQARTFSATHLYITAETADAHIRSLISEVMIVYRNDTKDNNETFGFDIRNLWDLSEVLYERAVAKNDWIDVGGRKNWRKYSFSGFKYTESEASQYGINQEVLLVCPFKTIVLVKGNDRKYTKIANIPSTTLQIFDEKRKDYELSQNCLYRVIQNSIYTDKYDYQITLDVFDKDTTVMIFNDLDCRSIQFFEQSVEGSQFKITKYDISDTFQTEIVKKVAASKGVNKLIAEMNPWLRYQYIVNKGITNMVYYTNPANEHGKINVSTASNLLTDADLKLLKFFRTPVLETQTLSYSKKLIDKAGNNISSFMFLDKCTFFQDHDDVEKKSKKIFIMGEDGEPQIDHVSFGDSDLNKWTSKALLCLQEKTVYAHDDKSVRPFIMIDTNGTYMNDTAIKRVWLAFIDIQQMRIVHLQEAVFKMQQDACSWLSSSDMFQFSSSSHISTTVENGKVVYTQNYHLLHNNPELSFHEILEYQVKYIMEGTKIVEVQTEQIGLTNFITSETFKSGTVQIYSMFDHENEIIGTQLIFGGSVGQKSIYPIPNPDSYFDDEERKTKKAEFNDYFMTSVRQINFRARLVGETDIACLTQIRFNKLFMKNIHVFNDFDKAVILDHTLRIANNIVPFHLNKIIDFKQDAVDCLYQPHQPLNLLKNQNILNLSNKNTAELKNHLAYLRGKDQLHIPGALELIMDTYNSSMKITAFRKHGLLMDKSLLVNTMDFNMMSAIDHSIQSNIKLATEMLFAYLDEQTANGFNYFLTMKSIEILLYNELGDCLCLFLEDGAPTTNLNVIQTDDRLDANQMDTYVDYYDFDHTDCYAGSKAQALREQRIVDRFHEVVGKKNVNNDPQDMNAYAEKEIKTDTIRVTYSVVDFSATLFQRKLDKIAESKFGDEMEQSIMKRSELIKMIEQTIDQTGNELDKQPSIRQIIEQIFREKTYNFNLKLLYCILLFQYFPFLILTFQDLDSSDNLMRWIFICSQCLVILFVGYIEMIQLWNNGFEKHYSSWENFNDQLFIVINLIQVIFKVVFLRDGKDILPDWKVLTEAPGGSDLILTSQIESFRGGSTNGIEKIGEDLKNEFKPLDSYRELLIIVNAIMLVSSSVKVLNILQMFDSIGSQVTLVFATIRDIFGFLIFMFIFIITLAAFYRLVGAQFEDDDYPAVNPYFVFVFQCLRNSIGDIAVPQYTFWINQAQIGNKIYSDFMIMSIWVIFYSVNVIILLVCLMNFLIAIVGETYSVVMQNHVNNVFRFQSYLNNEYVEIFGSSSVDDKKFSKILLVSSAEANTDLSVAEIVKDMKKSISRRIETQQKVTNLKLEQIHQETLAFRTELMDQIKNQNQATSREISEIKESNESLEAILKGML